MDLSRFLIMSALSFLVITATPTWASDENMIARGERGNRGERSFQGGQHQAFQGEHQSFQNQPRSFQQGQFQHQGNLNRNAYNRNYGMDRHNVNAWGVNPGGTVIYGGDQGTQYVPVPYPTSDLPPLPPSPNSSYSQ